MKDVRPAVAAVTDQSTSTGHTVSTGKRAKGAGPSSAKAAERPDRAFGNAFDPPGRQAAGVAVGGLGVTSGTGRGHDKDVAGTDLGSKDVAGRDSGRGGDGPGGGKGGPGGGTGGGGGGKAK